MLKGLIEPVLVLQHSQLVVDWPWVLGRTGLIGPLVVIDILAVG